MSQKINKIQVKDCPSVKQIVYMSLAISVMLHLVTFLSLRFSEGFVFQQLKDYKPHPFHIEGFVLNIVFTFVLAFMLYIFNMYMHKSKMKNKNLKLFVTILGLLLITIVMSCVFTSLHPLILGHSEHSLPMHRKVGIYRNGLMRDLFVAIVTLFSWQLLVSYYKSRRIAVENEALVVENLVTRYEVLKNQMNPHFLFNSLNTLQSLIEIDKEKAKDYVQELSKVLRYALQNQEIVTLEEEVCLANSYCNLMKIRYGDNLIVNFNIDEKMMVDYIIPLSLQVLIENAIKHNVISDKQPLTINIISDIENHKVVVNNKIQPKIGKSAGDGIGLANLSERYRLKWNFDLEILNYDSEFSVALKLKSNK